MVSKILVRFTFSARKLSPVPSHQINNSSAAKKIPPETGRILSKTTSNLIFPEIYLSSVISDKRGRSIFMTHAFTVNVISHLADLRGIKRHFGIELICIWVRQRELNICGFFKPTFGRAAASRF